MDTLVVYKMLLLAETLPTFTAAERFLTSVPSLMPCQIGLLIEGFPTIIALIWSLSCVFSLVDKERGTPIELLPTFIADQLPFFTRDFRTRVTLFF